MQYATVLCYNSFRVINMERQGSHFLRELIRILVRNLDILEKTECCSTGTTLAQCHAIVEVGRAEEISLNELADLLTLDKSTMSRTINNLVEEGIAIRQSHSEDRRYISINLTEKGVELFNSIEGSMEEYYQSIFKSIPEANREQVLESLELLIGAVKKNKCCSK